MFHPCLGIYSLKPQLRPDGQSPTATRAGEKLHLESGQKADKTARVWNRLPVSAPKSAPPGMEGVVGSIPTRSTNCYHSLINYLKTQQIAGQHLDKNGMVDIAPERTPCHAPHVGCTSSLATAPIANTTPNTAKPTVLQTVAATA